MTKTLKVVHVSDTHTRHRELTSRIPDGDILIHSGDFSRKLRENDFETFLAEFNDWLASLPHRHKIVIAGNHEIAFNNHTREEIQSRLPACHYLQDTSVEVEGLVIYGSPWTGNTNMGFSAGRDERARLWAQVPSTVDILVTHSPPFNVHDLAFSGGVTKDSIKECQVCGKIHDRYRHWGDPALLHEITTRIRPKLHCFGHVHDDVGVTEINGVTFSNAAMDINPVANVHNIKADDRPLWSLSHGRVKYLPTGQYVTVDPKKGTVYLDSKNRLFRSRQKWDTHGDGEGKENDDHLLLLSRCMDGLSISMDGRDPAVSHPDYRFKLAKLCGV